MRAITTAYPQPFAMPKRSSHASAPNRDPSTDGRAAQQDVTQLRKPSRALGPPISRIVIGRGVVYSNALMAT